MAPIARRNWEQMREELMQRLGKLNVATWEPRAERFVTAAYYDIALTWHQYELDTTVALAVAEDVSSLDLSTLDPTLYSIMAVRLLSEDGLITQVTQQHRKFNFQERLPKGRPSKWARQGNILHFERPSDGDYLADILYYAYPTTPDFEDLNAGSQLGWLWDEHILQRAMFLAAPATWRYDMSQVQVQTLQEFLESQPQASNKAGLVGRAEVPLSSQNQGGGQ